MSNFLFRYVLYKNFTRGIFRKNVFYIKTDKKLTFHLFSAKCMSTISRVAGVKSYEEERTSYSVKLPEYFNFASDVLDAWALKEKEGTRNSTVPAFWHVSDEGKELKLSYEELQEQTKKVAVLLQHHCGIKKGDYVMVMLPKIPEFWLITVAALRIGCILSPTPMMLREKDLLYRLSSLKPVCIIAHETVADVLDNISSSCSFLKEKVIIADSPTKRAGWIDFNRLKNKGSDHKCAVTKGDEAVMLYFTSGTTGNPKMVEHMHANFCIGLHDVGKYMLDLNSCNIMWNMSDTGWVKTAYTSIFAPWSRGACVFIHQMTKFDPLKTLKVLCEYPVDTWCAPPLAFRAMVQEDLSSYKFNKLQHVISGGESCNPEIIKKWIAATGIRIYEGYGLTENAALITMQKTFDYKIGSMGKPLPGRIATIVDSNEQEVGPNVIGEIVAGRETVGLFRGYKDNPKGNMSKLTNKYHHTGDIAYYDENGYFYFVGRNDDIINSAGYRIGPSEVENALMEHPTVAEVAVASSPDEERGEVVKAFILLAKNIEPSAELVQELQEYCKKVTAPYKYPRKIEFVKEFPKTITGKIKRSDLKEREWKNHQRISK